MNCGIKAGIVWICEAESKGVRDTAATLWRVGRAAATSTL